MEKIVIGVLSDTHGILRSETFNALTGCHRIIHAGDVGDPEILEILRKIAPVTAVRGNMDYGEYAFSLNKRENLRIENKTIHVLHNILDLNPEPSPEDIQMVIHGHTHHAKIERKNGIIYLNPGTSGAHRHADSGSIAKCAVSRDDISCKIVSLSFRPA